MASTSRRLALIVGALMAAGVLAWLHGLWRAGRPAADDTNAGGIPRALFRAPVTEIDHFRGMDGGARLTPAEVRGRNTWMVWTGGDEAFWDDLADHSAGNFDLLKTLSSFPCSPDQELHARAYEARLAAAGAPAAPGAEDGGAWAAVTPPGAYEPSDRRYPGACASAPARPGQPAYRYYNRDDRFCFQGVINEPGFTRATRPDEYGLCLDRRTPGTPPDDFDEAVYGRASGVVGLRLYRNPDFDTAARARWAAAMRTDAFYTDPAFYSHHHLVRPYRVGMACAFCHVGPHPLHPPADPEHPRLADLSGTIGAQYLWPGRVFGANLTPDNFAWHRLGSQRPGAVDPSFITTGAITNSRAMSAIFDLAERRVHGPRSAPAAARPALGAGVPRLLANDADLAAYLVRVGAPMRLRDAPGGAAYLDVPVAALDRGKRLFAATCAGCHSSKRPPQPEPPPSVPRLGDPACAGARYRQCWDAYLRWTETPAFKAQMTSIVTAPDFLDHNSLSNGARVPVTQLRTEICASLAGNAAAGHPREDLAAQSYQQLPAVGPIDLYEPLQAKSFRWTAPGGGRGYLRVPSLIAVWATAPFLHNNEVGLFTGDPSVKGRMEAFDDAIHKLLWPEKRGHYVHATDRRTDLAIAATSLPASTRLAARLLGLVDDGTVHLGPLPKGTPVNLLANLDTGGHDPHVRPWSVLRAVRRLKQALRTIRDQQLADPQAAALLKDLVPELIAVNACPDFEADRGHDFGKELTDPDKEALIAFIRTF